MKRNLLMVAAAFAVTGLASAQTPAPIPPIQEELLAQNTTPSGPPAGGATTPAAESKSTGWKGPIGYPGNTWGTLYYNAGSDNRRGLGTPRWETQGIVEQGIDWFRFGDGTWKFNTYGAIEYVINDNDKLFIPVLGMKVNKRFENGSLDIGIRVKNRNITVSGINGYDGSETFNRKKTATVQIFATYWFDWNLKKSATGE